MKLTKELCEALIGLRESRGFKVFLDALKEDEATEIQRSLSLEGAQCHRAQGAVLKVQEIMDHVADAPAQFEKFKQPKT